MAVTRFPFGFSLQTILTLLCLLFAQGNAQRNPMSAPKGGDKISAGKPYTIKWSPGTSGPVYISLSYGKDQIVGNLTDSTSNSGSFVWTPDNVLAGFNRGQNYFIAICDIKTEDCSYTLNGRFSIDAASTAVPTIITKTITSAGTAVSTVTATYTASVSSTSSASASPSPSSGSNFLSNPSSGSLSTGAKIAIGIVIPVVAIATLAVALYMLRRRRQSKLPAPESGPALTDTTNGTQPLIELSSQNVHMKGGQRGGLYELETSQNPRRY